MADPSDHRISLQDAIVLTHRWQAANKDNGPRAWWFAREAFEALLAEPGARGIRIYMGAGEKGPTPVMCPTDAEGRDLTGRYLAELSFPCPPHCDDESPLLWRVR